MSQNLKPQERDRLRALRRPRPPAIAKPGPGQESVWDYPRPPRIEPVPDRLRVVFAGITLAETVDGLRVLETSSPPVYYFPPADVRTEFLTRMVHTTLCEWKGLATYWTADVRGRRQEAIAWSHERPDEGYERIAGHFAFYAGLADACFIGDEWVIPQASDYYGGWVTPRIVGPFKGGPGTEAW